MSQQNLVEVFEDTKQQVLSGTIKPTAVTLKKRMDMMGIPIARNYITEVSIQNTDTVSAAQALSGTGKTAVLNMASPTRPGGGVINGARAQEECLFRCSDLFATIDGQYYPLTNDEGLYTTNAIFFKDKDYNNAIPFVSDVITVAALNLTDEQVGVISYMDTTVAKVRLILQLANENGVENLVLGAWGCGVFKNSPRTIAELFMQELKPYIGCFKQVVFAVINDHNSVGDNFDVFQDVIEYRKKGLSRI